VGFRVLKERFIYLKNTSQEDTNGSLALHHWPDCLENGMDMSLT